MIAKTLSLSNLSRLGPWLSGFFSWWKGELKGVFPKRLVSWVGSQENNLLVHFGQETIVIEDHAGQTIQNHLQSLGLEPFFKNLPKDITRIEVTVDQALLFKKTIKIPKANPAEIRKIVELQIERLFPLEKDHLYFSTSAPDKGRVTLYVLKRTDIDPFIKALKASPLKDKKLVVLPSGTEQESPFLIPLAASILSFGILKNTFIFSLAFWLFISVGFVLYLDWRTSTLEQEIADLQGAVSAEMATVSAYEGRVLKEQAIASVLKETPILSLFDTLSEVFPENSWIDDVSISGNQIVLSGTHPSPPDLVSGLTETGTFQNVRLTSSEEISGISRFQITLTLGATPSGEAQ